jgi:hypothetical protein
MTGISGSTKVQYLDIFITCIVLRTKTADLFVFDFLGSLGRNGWWQYDERTSAEIEAHQKVPYRYLFKRLSCDVEYHIADY